MSPRAVSVILACAIALLCDGTAFAEGQAKPDTSSKAGNIASGTGLGSVEDLAFGNRLIGLLVTDDNIVWGTIAGLTEDNIVWGTFLDADNIVWGTVLRGDDNIVWGTLRGDNIVWGTLRNGDNIVWGTLREGDNIVWGTLSSPEGR